jgi:di/tripeptidase
MRYLCQQSPLARHLKSFVVLDGPSTEHITSQALECRRFEVTFSGPGGHSWSDYGIVNPVHAVSRAIAWFSEDQPDGAVSPGGRASFNFGLIEGGSSVNSIPTLARAKLDIRSESSQRMQELVDALSAAVERAAEAENDRATGGRISARIREIGMRPGGSLPEKAPILAYFRAVDAHLGIRSRLDCASTDANVPLAMGLPAVSVGAGGRGGGAHTPAEWYQADGRDLGLKRIFLALYCLLLDPESSRSGK